MPQHRAEISRAANRVLTLLVVLGLGALARAQTFTTLYDFTNYSDGGTPYAGLIQDKAGNLYGTTYSGGDSNDDGVVYSVNTAGTQTVLYTFAGYPSDGSSPQTPVTRDKTGNIYGTTFYGGSGSNGTVFKIDTAGNETVLYRFTGKSDGCGPLQGLLRDSSGNLYGTTSSCGSSGCGTIFKVDIDGNFTVLHSFTGGPSDGSYPIFGHLAMDKSGDVYGLTETGGAYSYGVLYKLSKSGSFTLLHSFKGGTADGCLPVGTALEDADGNLYGTTFLCGSNNGGTIWELSKTGKQTLLHNFAGGTSDGCQPDAGVSRDSKGNLFGATMTCGANNYGALYKLSVKGKLTLLHSFAGPDGTYPYGEVLRSAKGTLFGTASQGGAYSSGTVWSYVP